MQKILILSYFFPPCNLTASQRILGWAKYLNEFGYYPIIITRNWDIPIKEPKDLHKSTGNSLIIKKHANYEAHYVPYKSNFRDYLVVANNPFSKIFTFVELVFQNFTNFVIPYSNIYNYSTSFLANNKDVKKLIVSANPFVMFKFGFMLNKKHGIKWVADYRDDWSTSEIDGSNEKSSYLRYLSKKLDTKSEKKWVTSSSAVTTVSTHFVKKLTSFLKFKNVYEIQNGFFDIKNTKKPQNTAFTITYTGTLYKSQPIELFIETVLKLIDNNFKLKINFPGIAFDKDQVNRINKLIKGYEPYFLLSDRIHKKEILQIEQSSDLLLMISHNNIKGIPSSKIYEYISLKKPILLIPSDNDIIEEILTNTQLGIIANASDECYNKLKELYLLWKENKPLIKAPSNLIIEQYSRKRSTEKLAKILDQL